MSAASLNIGISVRDAPSLYYESINNVTTTRRRGAMMSLIMLIAANNGGGDVELGRMRLTGAMIFRFVCDSSTPAPSSMPTRERQASAPTFAQSRASSRRRPNPAYCRDASNASPSSASRRRGIAAPRGRVADGDAGID